MYSHAAYTLRTSANSHKHATEVFCKQYASNKLTVTLLY